MCPPLPPPPPPWIGLILWHWPSVEKYISSELSEDSTSRFLFKMTVRIRSTGQVLFSSVLQKFTKFLGTFVFVDRIRTLSAHPLLRRSGSFIDTSRYVSATMSTRLYPVGNNLIIWNVSSSYVPGILVIVLTKATYAITSHFCGNSALSIKVESKIIISVSLLFCILLLEPFGLDRFKSTGQRGNSNALLKSINCPVFADNARRFPMTFSVHLNRLQLPIFLHHNFFPQSLNKTNLLRVKV